MARLSTRSQTRGRRTRSGQQATSGAPQRVPTSLAAPVPQPQAATNRSRVIFTEVPDTISRWRIAANNARLLLMAVKHDPMSFDPASFDGMAQRVFNARGILQKLAPFQSYINVIANNGFLGAGDFTPPRKQQRELFDLDKDESPVNATFINMLQAIAELAPLHPDLTTPRTRWRHTKKAFVAKFFYGRGYEARTDGQLESYETNAVEAIVECKAKPRQGYVGRQVDMQEAAQVVAWIKAHEDPAKLRILVSQNGADVYVTFAEYDDNWLKYIRTGKLRPLSLLRMNQFGPYPLDDADMIQKLAEVLLAICL
ncbi:hypothetical protein PISL3812_02551 [Talaromyces islandicus]|uniref:Uncharacterized protein n=1 Tax=Talaromyces islandicus TaxID=28573 RepID=A0A0U1LQZ7_TALIS|nr:hypothetical protein PISL3812_02551 [Talaromyces islandicus]